MRPPLALPHYQGPNTALSQQASVESICSDGGGALTSALAIRGAQHALAPAGAMAAGSPVAAKPFASLSSFGSPEAADMHRRRSAAAAAKAVLTLSEIDGVDGAAPSRRRFPPGAGSLAKFQSYQSTHTPPGGGLAGGMGMAMGLAPSASIALLPTYKNEASSSGGGSGGYGASAGLLGAGGVESLPAMGASQSAAVLPTRSQRSLGKAPMNTSRYLAAGSSLFSSGGANEDFLATEGGGGMRAPVIIPGPDNV